MANYASTKVFTPTSPAIDSFVERSRRINSHLVDALRTPGKQIVLYGHSGCGKTTLLTNKLNQLYENTVTTRCMAGMTFESIILNAFDQLGKFYTESTKTKGFKIAPAITINYQEIKAVVSLGEVSNLASTSSKSFVPPQLTPQRLAGFFGESKSCWILEDFHKIKGAEKAKASQMMKIFMDMSPEYPDLKLIALGAVGTARNVIAYDSEMNNRVSEILIPYMSNPEISSIIDRGEKLLNIKFTPKTKDKIVRYSCGLPSICHQLCLNICFNKEINSTSAISILIDTQDLDEAIEKYVDEKSDTLKSEYDKAVKISNHTKENIFKAIINAVLLISKDEFSFDDICVYMKSKTFRKEEIEKKLNELCLIERGEILVFDDNSNKYRFNNLFLKGYAMLQFEIDKARANKAQISIEGIKDQKMIDRLLEIIENDLMDDDFEIEEV